MGGIGNLGMIGPVLAVAMFGAVHGTPARSAEKGLQTPLPPPAIAVSTARSDPNRRARPPGAYDGPIADAHVHLRPPRDGSHPDSALERLFKGARKAGVARLLFMPTPNESRFRNPGEGVGAMARLASLHPGRVGRACGSDYLTAWMHDAFREGYGDGELAARLGRLRRDIEAGGCLGVGEIGPYHFIKSPGQLVLHFPLNFQPLLAVAGVAAELGVPMELHNEPVDHEGKSYATAIFGGVALLLRLYPGLKLVLSHTAMTNTANARALLGAYPGLMMNLKIAPPRISWEHLEKVTNADGELFEDWARLMEDMPDRFMIGADAHFFRQRKGGRTYGPRRYRKAIRQLRAVLGSLAPAAAVKIAHDNAVNLWWGKGG